MSSLAIVIPTYNHDIYLESAIDSVLNQSCPAAHIVVSDNHSTDGTPQILERYAGRVEVIRPPRHLPVNDHFNFVGNHVDSDWVAFLGSDDVAKPVFVEALMRGAHRCADAVLVHAEFETIDGAGRATSIGRSITTRQVERPPRSIRQQVEVPRINLSASAVLHSAWLKVGGFATELNLFGDMALYLRLANMGAFVYEHAIVSQYRVGYDAGKDRRRILAELEDDYRIATQIIPEVTRAMSSLDRLRVRRAMRRRFVRRVAHASTILDDTERGAALSTIAAWGAAVRCPDVVRAYETGAIIPQPDRVRTKVKSMTHAAYDAARRLHARI